MGSIRLLSSFAFLHAIIDLTPHRPPTPRSACTNDPERNFFTCLFPPWASSSFHSQCQFSFPTKRLVQRSETTSKEIRMLKAPLCLFHSTCATAYDQASRERRNFLIDHTQRPRAESSFFHTQAQRCMSTYLAIKVPTPGPT